MSLEKVGAVNYEECHYQGQTGDLFGGENSDGVALNAGRDGGEGMGSFPFIAAGRSQGHAVIAPHFYRPLEKGKRPHIISFNLLILLNY